MRLNKILLSFLLVVISAGHALAGKSDVNHPDSLPVMDYNYPKRYILKDINITGVNFINPTLVASYIGINKGDTIDIPGNYITNAVQKLWDQKFYSDIQAVVEIEQDSAYLELRLKERPRVSEWDIEGVSSGHRKKLIEDVVKLRKHSTLSEYTVQNAVNSIKKFYIDKGFLNVEVTPVLRNDTLKLNNTNFVTMTFNVDKGPRIKIKEIHIRGNEQLEEAKLKRAMKNTREKTLVNFFKSSKLNQEKLDKDKISLVEYMQSKGFRDAAYLSDSVYTINDKRIGMVIDVYEGDKYYFRDITWTGNVKYSDKVLDNLLGIKKGDVYDKKTMNSRLGLDAESVMTGTLNVSSLYKDDGHLAFNLEPVETIVANDSIDIDMRIQEGKQFRINEVTIGGNTRTNDRVIRRELDTRPGELYSQSLLVNSLRRIGSMGHFTENIIPDIMPVSDQLVDIKFNVEETSNDQLEVSGGWGAGTFVASVGITFNNVAMRNFFKKDYWRPYPAGDNQKINLRFQTNGVYYKSFSFTFFEPWLGGHKPNSFSISAYYSDQSNAYYTFQKATAHFGTAGASIMFGKRLAWPDPFFTISAQLNYQAYILDNWNSFIIKNGNSNIFSLSFQLSRNSLDHPIFPRSGSEFTLKGTFTPPYSAFRPDSYYTDPTKTLNDYYKWVEYYKVEGGFKWFFPMLNNQKLVLMVRGDFGYLGHYKNTKYAKSPFEGYSVGGDGITGYDIYGVNYIGLRGYKESSLTPYASRGGEQAQAYTKYTVELRYPFVSQGSTMVFGLIFAEGGNAYYGWRQFNPFDLKKSLGAGVRLYLPIIGLLGLDWGYGFDAPVPGAKRGGSNFHFSIGQTF